MPCSNLPRMVTSPAAFSVILRPHSHLAIRIERFFLASFFFLHNALYDFNGLPYAGQTWQSSSWRIFPHSDLHSYYRVFSRVCCTFWHVAKLVFASHIWGSINNHIFHRFLGAYTEMRVSVSITGMRKCERSLKANSGKILNTPFIHSK